MTDGERERVERLLKTALSGLGGYWGRGQKWRRRGLEGMVRVVEMISSVSPHLWEWNLQVWIYVKIRLRKDMNRVVVATE